MYVDIGVGGRKYVTQFATEYFVYTMPFLQQAAFVVSAQAIQVTFVLLARAVLFAVLRRIVADTHPIQSPVQ